MQNLKNKTDKNPLHTISVVYFLEARLFTEKHSRTTTIHPGIFLGRALFKQQSVSVEELFNNYSSRGIFTNIHEPEANNCFSIITQVIIEIPKQRNVTTLPQFAIVVHFQVGVGVFNCQQILTKISFVIFNIEV